MNELIMWGFLGGMIPEIIAIYKLRNAKKEKRPEWLTSPFYWGVTVIMLCMGGILVSFYIYVLEVQVNEVLAIHIGVSAPMILQGLAQGKIYTN